MESKRETDFALKLNFLKTNHYFCFNRNNCSTYTKLTKSFGNFWSQDLMLKSSKNHFKTIKEKILVKIRSMKKFAHQILKGTKITSQTSIVTEASKIYHICKQATYQKHEFPF